MYETKLVAIHPPRMAYTRSLSDDRVDTFLVVRSALIYLSFVIAGIPVYSLLELFLRERSCFIVDSFLNLTSIHISNLPEYILGLYRCVKQDVLFLIVIYVCALSYLCTFFSNILLFLRGLSLGIALGYIVCALNSAALPLDVGTCLIMKEAVISAILLYAVFRSAKLSSRLRMLGYRQYGTMLVLLFGGCLQCVLFIGAIFLISIFFSFLL